MSSFDALTDQERPRRVLAGILAGGKIPGALLFTGIDGIGKKTAALWFARAVNCLARSSAGEPVAKTASMDDGAKNPEPCDSCAGCRKIKSGLHPDVVVIEPDKDVIKIARVRDLIEKIAFKPYQAKLRAIIINDAQAMNREASNALLKALEEPPSQTIFILTAEHASDLLPTVVSRCQQIRFNPVSVESIRRVLADCHGLSGEIAAMAAVMAEGSFARALSLAEDSGTARKMARHRQWLIDEVEQLPTRSLSMVLAFAEKLSRDKTHLKVSLDIIGLFLRDLLVAGYCPEKIINQDLADRILAGPAESEKKREKKLIKKLEALAATEAALTRNANQRLSLEVLALQLADI